MVNVLVYAAVGACAYAAPDDYGAEKIAEFAELMRFVELVEFAEYCGWLNTVAFARRFGYGYGEGGLAGGQNGHSAGGHAPRTSERL
ncbi:hypothetical protein [Streptomyces sp. NPDC045470]|uniref:hypothetical protein n=1 Tax=Streptomyces sp. NPDC045470 TaxID=3155469 RepID=UPI0033F6A936